MDTVQEKTLRKDLAALSIDYEKYGAGEAALAWLDASVIIHSKERSILKAYKLINDIFDEISFQKLSIGHLKFFLKSGEWQRKISYTSNKQERQDELSTEIIADRAAVIVNARVETHPGRLKEIFYHSLKKIEDQGSNIEVLKLGAFQPGSPTPTHRLHD
jgi:hypothetical protein